MTWILPSLSARILAALLMLQLLPAQGRCAPGTVTGWGGGQTNFPSGLTNVISISTSVDHSLALLNDGTVAAWGCDDDGECDVPSGLTNVISLAAGDFFSLALLSN